MKFSDQDLGAALWMLERQIETPFDLISIWLLFPREVRRCPMIEKVKPAWTRGLEREIERSAG